VSLKKPTEFFGKNNNKKEEVATNLPENLGEYKSNLKNIEVLNEFTENFGSFADNITKINTLEEGIQELKEELKNTLTQDDLDNAVMSNLLILEKNIDNIQKSLKGINRENLKNIYEEVENISNQVSLVTEELPRYKNLIKSNEVYLDKKLIQYQENINENLTDFSNFIDNKFDIIEQSIENSIEGINESALNEITTNVKNIEKLVNTEIPRHKKQVTEKVIEIDEKFSSYQKNIENYQEQIQLKIQEVQQSFETLIENEVPKYQSLLVSAKIENDKKIESIVNKLTHKIKALAENTLKLNEELEEKSNVLDQSFETKISALESYILNAKKEAEETTQTYRKLYQVIEAKGLSDRSQFDTYEKAISHISSQFSSVYEKIEETKKEIEKKELYQEELNDIQESFNHKFIQIETLIESKNQRLKEANEVLVDNIVSLKEEVSKISVDELHQNYHQISRKVNHIEEVFNKFNEKTLLNEGLLNEPPQIKTSDPLTPLDQKFVTLDQLQEHYRTFINRIQQQLSTLGGGGETRLEFLDDVDRDSAKTDGYVLAYQASTGKFIGTEISVGSASQWVSTTVGIHTFSNVGIGTTNPTEALFVVGNAVFTGNISVAGTITYDDVTSVDSIGVITARQDVIIQRNLFVAGITTLGASNGIGTVTIGIGNTALHVNGNARVTGILSIGQGTVTIDGNNNTITAGEVTITGSSITLGDNVTINAGATGINSAPNVLYVAKDGR
jgi:DNA repair exonuclease SbcCD ATPase subunit